MCIRDSPLSTYLFALTLQPVIEAVSAVVPVAAFVDDATLVGRPDALRRAFPVFADGCKADGRNLEAAPEKCSLHGGDATEVAALAEELGVQHRPDGFVAYGTPIGTEAFIAATMAERRRHCGRGAAAHGAAAAAAIPVAAVALIALGATRAPEAHGAVGAAR